MGMSRDSLNGTVPGTNILETNGNRREQHMAASPIPTIKQTVSTEPDPKAEKASTTIQRWYRENHTKRKTTEAESNKLVIE
jgi:hypothetical protein